MIYDKKVKESLENGFATIEQLKEIRDKLNAVLAYEEECKLEITIYGKYTTVGAEVEDMIFGLNKVITNREQKMKDQS